MKGYTQVYTGNGKGKTTAALGLALRALGAGKSVYVGQFAKRGRYSEITALDTLARAMPGNRCTCEQFGRARKAGSPFEEEDGELARAGLKRSLDVLSGGTYDLVILDELNLALGRGLLNEEDFRALLTAKNGAT
ncbi:MAG: cob(I)yrinic acid a,c-diamide adenosyltransferase, partial [Spirochaetaceae bacterium]|nr:cob(I)yrinic acid a,c-diamide adenosyltransferase [Spirochaetaceae bacterium]